MRAVVGGRDLNLGETLAGLADEQGYQVVRARSVEDVLREMRSAGSVAIIDAEWALMQKPGAIRLLVDTCHGFGNKVICLCPDDGGELVEIARLSRADRVFTRFELRTRFRDYLENLLAA